MAQRKKQIRRILAILLVITAVALPCLVITAANRFTIDEATLAKAERIYGLDARQRLLAWQDLIVQDNSTTDQEKLEKVNSFFNRTVEFVDDIYHWRQEDYWATPIEFLASGAGDCEDYSIAKYFTLKAMGVPESKLNLSYVKALRFNQHHMVMTYYSTPSAEPLVLDNLVPNVLPASRRTDLVPIYSFNGTALWLAKQRGRGKLVGSSSRLQRWQDLLERMPDSMR